MWGFFGLNDGLTTSIALLRSLASAQRPEGLFVCLLSERKPGRVCEHLGQRIPLQAPLLWPSALICGEPCRLRDLKTFGYYPTAGENRAKVAARAI